jgi:hypothetical protein
MGVAVINDHYNEDLQDFTRTEIAAITVAVLVSVAIAIPLAGVATVSKWIRRGAR